MQDQELEFGLLDEFFGQKLQDEADIIDAQARSSAVFLQGDHRSVALERYIGLSSTSTRFVSAVVQGQGCPSSSNTAGVETRLPGDAPDKSIIQHGNGVKSVEVENGKVTIIFM
ncbi:hypothetical protein BOX15_Mlig003150g1 [Macrostomum lignano]|uniref:Uncharacterized protein n=1 Tax=Macrostomum lignano TaxID=282301 RepID=A0A267EF44_9PLAT|nr:hypothetical protein BOX15_Mlig003150g1 [Macrostomum lignano]